jgi:cellulose biosynthesis protein BcsQ
MVSEGVTMRQIAFFSQKGGCGKTTACVNIAAALGGLGRRVLVMDLDSNACASRTFGVLETLENSIAAALLGLRPLACVVIDTAVPNVWLAPGATDLYTLDDAEGVRDASRLDASGRLSPIVLNLELSRLDPAQFDYVLLDCAGGHPFIAHLALLACDEVIIPTGLAVYDLYAATPAMHLILMAREARGDDKPDFLGFLPNGAGRQGVPDRIQAKLDQYALPCLPAIRHSELLKTLAGAHDVVKRFVVLSRPNTAVAASFQQAAQQIDSGVVAEPTIDRVEPVEVGNFAVAASAENGSTATAIDSAVL